MSLRSRPTITKTVTYLADGRELIYYDENKHSGKPGDRHEIDPLLARPELRHDPLLDEWVVVAVQRQCRTHMPPGDQCPLCPSSTEYRTEIPAPDFTPRRATDRLKHLAGSESGAGVFINDFCPEEAARRLRNALGGR